MVVLCVQIMADGQETELTAPKKPDESRVGIFQRRVGWLWRTVLVRRSQRAKMRWARLYPLLYRWIPQPRVLHPYPDARFAATHPG